MLKNTEEKALQCLQTAVKAFGHCYVQLFCGGLYVHVPGSLIVELPYRPETTPGETFSLHRTAVERAIKNPLRVSVLDALREEVRQANFNPKHFEELGRLPAEGGFLIKVDFPRIDKVLFDVLGQRKQDHREYPRCYYLRGDEWVVEADGVEATVKSEIAENESTEGGFLTKPAIKWLREKFDLNPKLKVYSDSNSTLSTTDGELVFQNQDFQLPEIGLRERASAAQVLEEEQAYSLSRSTLLSARRHILRRKKEEVSPKVCRFIGHKFTLADQVCEKSPGFCDLELDIRDVLLAASVFSSDRLCNEIEVRDRLFRAESGEQFGLISMSGKDANLYFRTEVRDEYASF